MSKLAARWTKYTLKQRCCQTNGQSFECFKAFFFTITKMMETDIQSDSVPSKVNSGEPKESKKARLGDNDEVIIPEEKNTPIDNLKKRRSSLRRSVNAGFTSTLIGTVYNNQ